jgi:hypothetical protein
LTGIQCSFTRERSALLDCKEIARIQFVDYLEFIPPLARAAKFLPAMTSPLRSRSGGEAEVIETQAGAS